MSSKNYILRYSAVGTKNNGSVGISLRQGKSPYHRLTPIKFYTVSTDRVDNEVLLSFPESDDNGQIIFQFNDRDSTVYLDNIQLYEADVTIINPDDYVRFEYNPTNNTKTIALDASYVDVGNNVYSGNISLAPYSSIILIKQSATSLITTNKVTSSTKINNRNNLLNSTELKLTAFPNPSPLEFNLLIQSNSSEKVEINLFDVNGKNMLNATGNAKQKYTLGRNLPAGSYILKVTQGTNVQTLKLIK